MRTSDILTQPLGLQQKDVPLTQGETIAPGNESPAQSAHHWLRVCALDEIPRLGARVVRRDGAPNVAIFRTADDQLFALADRCPHRGGPLSQGIVFGQRVACPLHNTCIDLDTGCAVAPDKGEVERYSVKTDAGIVYLCLSDANG